ncbi:MAG TPA: iron-containing alcohol dehydrogenase [Tepidisphaeraceae bacterium]
MRATFSFPTTILFGPGAVGELPQRATDFHARRPLLVTDPGLAKTRTFARVRDLFPNSAVFTGVHGNPTEADAENATRAFLEHQCDSVIAVGGGSALDVGKVLRLRAKFPQHTNPDLATVSIRENLAPFIAIPTTAGTGSEVGRSSVITIAGTKHVIFNARLLADLVILDPELTVELPAKLTAATGADALTHCIESFTSPVFNPLCEAIALEGIHLIAQSLVRAVNTPNDIDARGKMQLAAMMGGIAFQKDLGAAHSLAHPLGAVCNIHHGLANALVLPAVMRFNAERKPGLYTRVARALTPSPGTPGEGGGEGPSADNAAIAAVQSLFSGIGLTTGLRSAGVQKSQLQTLADHAFKDPCHQTNPVPVTRGDLLLLYQQSM